MNKWTQTQNPEDQCKFIKRAQTQLENEITVQRLSIGTPERKSD